MAANVKILITSLFTVKMKQISSPVPRYAFSAVGEILVTTEKYFAGNDK